MPVSIRTWLRAPGLFAAAVFTLALGIGSSTALFSIVHAVLIAPLPYADAGALAIVRAEQDFEGTSRPVGAAFQPDAVALWPKDGQTVASTAFHADGVASLARTSGSVLVDTVAVVGTVFPDAGRPYGAWPRADRSRR